MTDLQADPGSALFRSPAKPWAASVPVSFFGIVLGLAGLGSAWRAGHLLWGLPAIVGEMLFVFASVVWIVLVLCYAMKWIANRPAAAAEWTHPVDGCFVGLVGVATMLIAGGLLPYLRATAELVFATGLLFTLGFAVWRTGDLWAGGRDPVSNTAVLYLPTVAGSFVTGTVAAALGRADWGQLAFGAGLFSWISIESVLLHRLLTASELTPALRPTLGLQFAPAPVGTVCYLAVTAGPPDLVAHAMLGYGLLQAAILLRLLPWLRRGGFAPSYWAFTFGATALGTAPLRLLQRGDSGAIADIAPILFIGSNIVVALIGCGTLALLLQGRLLRRPER